jgi:hypothetical protein
VLCGRHDLGKLYHTNNHYIDGEVGIAEWVREEVIDQQTERSDRTHSVINFSSRAKEGEDCSIPGLQPSSDPRQRSQPTRLGPVSRQRRRSGCRQPSPETGAASEGGPTTHCERTMRNRDSSICFDGREITDSRAPELHEAGTRNRLSQ